jgi:sulfur carrier protein
MKVTINGDERELSAGTNVEQVVTELAGARRTGIAISLNGEVVPKSRWSHVAVSDGDRLEVLSAIGGG